MSKLPELSLPVPLLLAPDPLLAPFGSIDPNGRPAEKQRSVLIGSTRIDYVLRRSKRRSIGFVVGEHGLVVTAPSLVGVTRIEQAIRTRERWIVGKIAALHERRLSVPRVAWQHGGSIPYFGNPIRFHLSHDAAPARPGARTRLSGPVRLDVEAAQIDLGLPIGTPAHRIRERVVSWLRAEVARVFAERLDFYAPRLAVEYRAFALSSARTRWGSCTHDGRIRLNWRLVHFPPDALDYIVVHELAHLLEMNHSPRFWQLVAGVLPDYPARRAALKNPAPELLPHL